MAGELNAMIETVFMCPVDIFHHNFFKTCSKKSATPNEFIISLKKPMNPSFYPYNIRCRKKNTFCYDKKTKEFVDLVERIFRLMSKWSKQKPNNPPDML